MIAMTNTIQEITDKLKQEVFTLDKYRFEWFLAVDENNNPTKIYLIDNKSELLGIPTTLNYDNLTINDLENMKKWLKHLNNTEKK